MNAFGFLSLFIVIYWWRPNHNLFRDATKIWANNLKLMYKWGPPFFFSNKKWIKWPNMFPFVYKTKKPKNQKTLPFDRKICENPRIPGENWQSSIPDLSLSMNKTQHTCYHPSVYAATHTQAHTKIHRLKLNLFTSLITPNTESNLYSLGGMLPW